jgi:hypothetical protein
MGAGESVPRDLTHEKLFELTKDTRTVMNYILEYMIKEVTVKDFLALSNPNECKKYVLFMANTIYKYFYELQIEPVKDKKGVIAFRSIKDLAGSTQERDQEKQSLCLVLAYYYARIFQIYGALALTLIDDISFMSSTGILTTIQGDQQRLLAPGQRAVIYGGEISESTLGLFYFLKDYLNEPSYPQGYLTKFSSKVIRNSRVYFKLPEYPTSSTSEPLRIIRSSQNKGTFFIDDGKSSQYSELEISVDQTTTTSSSIYSIPSSSSSAPQYRVSIGKLTYHKLSSEGKDLRISIDIPTSYLSTTAKTFQVAQYSLPDKKTHYYIVVGKDVPLNDFLNALLDKVVYYAKEISQTGSAPKEFPQITTDPLSGKQIIKSNTSTTNTVISAISTTEQDTVEELKLNKIIHNLRQTKPLGHCIARALQLLRNPPFKGEAGLSYICKAKFYETSTKDVDGTKISRSGIPIPGKKIEDSPGLLALSQLFYDTISIGTPKLVISEKKGPSGKSSLDQYVEFMTKMSILFGNGKPEPSTLIDSGIHTLTNKRDKEICDQIKKDDIIISNDTAKNVYGIVQQLFQQQLKHSSVCGSIFKLLFNIKRDPSTKRVTISLSDNILKKGVPEINRINSIAREQLINYYTNCETKYLDGIKIIVNSLRKQNPKLSEEAQEKKDESEIRQKLKIRDSYLLRAQQAQESGDTNIAKEQQAKAQDFNRQARELASQFQQKKQVRFQASSPSTTTYTPSAPPMTIASAAYKSTAPSVAAASKSTAPSVAAPSKSTAPSVAATAKSTAPYVALPKSAIQPPIIKAADVKK